MDKAVVAIIQSRVPTILHTRRLSMLNRAYLTRTRIVIVLLVVVSREGKEICVGVGGLGIRRGLKLCLAWKQSFLFSTLTS
jgi:hypothetical protein